MPDPVYAVYYRRRGHGRRRARAAAGHGRHRLPPRPRRPAARAAGPHGAVLSVLAGQPAGRRRRPRLSAPGRAPGPPSTASCSRSTNATASSGTRRRRRARSRRLWPRAASFDRRRGVPLAEQALECRRACARASSPAIPPCSPGCCGCAPMPRRCSRCRCWPPPPRSGGDEAHVEANRARYRAKFDLARAPARQPLRLLPPGRRLLPVARRRRRRGRVPAALARGGRAGAAGRLPVRRQRPPTRARPTSGWPWSTRPDTVDGRSARLADGAGRRAMPASCEERPMAASTADAFAGAPVAVAGCAAACAVSAAPAHRAGGRPLAVALCSASIWRDPSLNQATAQPCTTRPGLAGAYAADLLYQLFGFAAWLPVLVGLSWGLRLALGRPLAWPWLPILSLPLALLAWPPFWPRCRCCRCASWPLRVGLGGAVGDLQWRCARAADRASAASPPAAWCWRCCSACTALGLRWAEGIWAAGRVAAGSLWVGRQLGDAAGAGRPSRSGRLVRDGWRGLELAPPSARPRHRRRPPRTMPPDGRAASSALPVPTARTRRAESCGRAAARGRAPEPGRRRPPRASASSVAEPTAPAPQPERKPGAAARAAAGAPGHRLRAAATSTCWRSRQGHEPAPASRRRRWPRPRASSRPCSTISASAARSSTPRPARW